MKNWILYEDNHIIIVNKPAKIPVQGDKTGDETLIDIVKNYIKKTYNKPGNVFVGLPHRIDRPTSGIVVLSKTSKSLSRMTEILREKKIKKTYWAIVKNQLKQDAGKLIHFLLPWAFRQQGSRAGNPFDQSAKLIIYLFPVPTRSPASRLAELCQKTAGSDLRNLFIYSFIVDSDGCPSLSPRSSVIKATGSQL